MGKAVRGIDHLVLPVRDLSAAVSLYQRLGFTVAPVAHHPFGTANAVVQLGNGYLELLTVEDAGKIPAADGFSFATYNRDFLARHEGFSMVALTSEDAAGDAAHFASLGVATLAPFDFARETTTAEGETKTLAFSLVFAQEPRLGEAVFFTCRHHYPENFWSETYRHHSNGATALAGAVMTAPDPADFHEFLYVMTGQHDIHSSSAGVGFPLRGTAIDVLSPLAARARYGDVVPDMETPRLVAFRITVPDLDGMRARMDAGRVEYSERAGAVIVPPSAGCGTAIIFETGQGG
ncbi:MAG: VOC family protein [Hyphomicrobiales bacterium]